MESLRIEFILSVRGYLAGEIEMRCRILGRLRF
jgi:hypothetical protein